MFCSEADGGMNTEMHLRKSNDSYLQVTLDKQIIAVM
jgi:hypothetical protein